MKLKTLHLRNLKGRDYDLTLAAINLITGPSWSGKTSILDGLRIGLLGYHPRLGKTNPATWELAGNGPVMAVTMGLDNGQTAGRTWENKNGSVAKKDVNMGRLEVPPVLLDMNDYFARTEAERVAYVFGMLRLEDFWNDGEFLKRLVRVEDALPAKDKLHMDLLEQQTEFISSTVDEREEVEQTVPQWMDRLVTRYREEWRSAKESAVRMQKSLEAQTQMASAGGLLGGDFTKTRAKEIQAAREEIQKLTGELTVGQEKLRAVTRAIHDRQALEQTLSETPDREADIKAVQKKLADLRKRGEGFDEGAEEQAREAWMKARMDLGRALNTQSEVDDLLKELRAELVEKGKLRQCPFCKSKAKGWQKHFQADIKARLEKATIDKVDAETERERLDKAVKAKNKLYVAAQEETKAHGQTRSLENTMLRELNGLITEHARHGQAKAALAQLKPSLGDGLHPEIFEERIRTTTHAIAQGNLRLAELDDAERKWHAHQAGVANRQKAQTELDLARAEQAVYDALVKFLVDEQRNAMAQGFGVILGQASQMFAGVLPYPLSFREGQIGWHTPRGWASWRTFSGTEEALALAALSVALARQSPFKVIVLDEMGRMSLDVKRAVAERLNVLVKDGALDQVFLVDSRADDYGDQGQGAAMDPDWNVIEVKGDA